VQRLMDGVPTFDVGELGLPFAHEILAKPARVQHGMSFHDEVCGSRRRYLSAPGSDQSTRAAVGSVQPPGATSVTPPVDDRAAASPRSARRGVAPI
jgi:hypothetical protein